MPANSRPTILYCGIVPYDSIRQRPQWLAEGIADRARVLYLNPHRSRLGGGDGRETLIRMSENLAVMTPPASMPLTGYWRPLNRLSYRRTAKKLLASFSHLGWSLPKAHYLSFPKQIDLLGNLPHAPVCYDVMDDYPNFFDPMQARVLTRLHEELLGRSDVVVASSGVLADRCCEVSRRSIELVQNGVASSFVRSCKTAIEASELADLPHPRLGYVGTIADWMDFRVIKELADGFPDGCVVLVGPVDCRLPRLPRNVHLLGSRPHAELPSLLRGFDLGIVPFEIGPATEAVNAVKVYEYLAAGLPILGSDLSELRRFGSVVRICREGQWSDQARQALSTPVDKDAQVRALKGATWEDRIDRVWHLLEKVTRN